VISLTLVIFSCCSGIQLEINFNNSSPSVDCNIDIVVVSTVSLNIGKMDVCSESSDSTVAAK